MRITPKNILSTRLKALYIIGIACALCVCARAQETTVRQPDLQTADNAFFDPTRKEKKVAEEYHFGVEYRLEVGYTQANQRTRNYTYPDLFLHGARLGATFTFLLPLRFSLQTGLLYSLSYGTQEQHWRSMDQQSVQTEYIRHRILQHNLTIPIRAYYTIPLWKQLNMFFYTGPQIQFGLAQSDYLTTHLSQPTQTWLVQQGIRTKPYERLSQGELYRTNIQYGIGGGFEWDRYRLQAGYDFGLNNLVKNKIIADQHLWEWSWYVSFSYKF